MGLPIAPAGAHRQPTNPNVKTEQHETTRYEIVHSALAGRQNHRSLQFLALHWPQNQSPCLRRLPGLCIKSS